MAFSVFNRHCCNAGQINLFNSPALPLKIQTYWGYWFWGKLVCGTSLVTRADIGCSCYCNNTSNSPPKPVSPNEILLIRVLSGSSFVQLSTSAATECPMEATRSSKQLTFLCNKKVSWVQSREIVAWRERDLLL